MKSNSRFSHHTSCPDCGSSDALAVYEDGSEFCFSEHKLKKKGSMSGYVLQRKQQDDESVLALPDDLSREYSQEAVEWAAQYGVKVSELMEHKVFFSKRLNQLIYVYQSMDKPSIGCIQGRNFTPGRTKYFNIGDTHKVFPVYHYSNPGDVSRIVLVEDALSAIKIVTGVWVDAMPLLGSSIPMHKLAEFRKRHYTHITVWLDHDKYESALAMAEKLKYLGLIVDVVRTDLDPKCYTHDEIARKLNLV